MKKLILLSVLLPALLALLQGCASSGRSAGNLVTTTAPTEIAASDGISITVPAGWVLVSSGSSKTVAYKKVEGLSRPPAKVMVAELGDAVIFSFPKQEKIRAMSEAEKAAFVQKYEAEMDKLSPPLTKVLAKRTILREINGNYFVVFYSTTKQWGDDPVCIVRADGEYGGQVKMIGVSYEAEFNNPAMEQEAESIINSSRLRAAERLP